MNSDHYATLGVAYTATATQIKDAYRHCAKTAHPDAGGSVEAMARVNEAYKILSDPAARRAYDGLSESREARPAASPYESSAPHPSEVHHPQHHEAAARAAAEEAAHIDRHRTAWARHSAWEMARLSAPVTVVVVLAMHYVPGHLATLSSRLAAGFLTFVPVYMLILSIVFLANPELRLVFADLIRHHRTTHHERLSALGLVLAFFPLAIIWLLLFLPW